MCRVTGALIALLYLLGNGGFARAHDLPPLECSSIIGNLRLHDKTKHTVKVNDLESSISGDDIRRANEEVEATLKNLGVVYREVPINSAYAMSYLDRRISKDHPLWGLAKSYEIFEAGQANHDSQIQNVLTHRGLPQKIKEINDLGATFIVDSSGYISGNLGHVLRFGTELRISHKADFSILEHELSHLRFHHEVGSRLFKSGLFTKFVDEYDRVLNERFADNSKINDLPFYPEISDSLDVDPERQRVLKVFADSFSPAERKRLLKEKNVLGYFLQGIHDGYIHISNIDEISATNLQKDLLREERISALHVARLDVHSYQLKFKILDLRQRKQLSIKQRAELLWLEKQDQVIAKILYPLMIRYGQDALVNWYKRAIETAPLGVYLLLSGSTSQEDEEKKKVDVTKKPED
jgi:hypothetical protein